MPAFTWPLGVGQFKVDFFLLMFFLREADFYRHSYSKERGRGGKEGRKNFHSRRRGLRSRSYSELLVFPGLPCASPSSSRAPALWKERRGNFWMEPRSVASPHAPGGNKKRSFQLHSPDPAALFPPPPPSVLCAEVIFESFSGKVTGRR